MSRERPLRVMICDDIEPIVEKYAMILETDPEIEVVGCAYTGKSAVEIALNVHPDVILMDIEMETCQAGITASRQILERLPCVKIVILTVHQADRMIFEAFSAGVVDYMLKNSASVDIIKGVKDAMDNKTSLDPSVFGKLRSEVTQIMQDQKNTMALINKLFRLSTMEIEVLDMFMSGMNRSQISRSRVVEMSTTKSQIHSILSKMEFSSMSELVNTLKLLRLEHFVKDML